MNGEDGTFSKEDRKVLDAAAYAVAASEAGFDDGVLGALVKALLHRVPFDVLTVGIEDHDRRAFRIFFRTGFEEVSPTLFPRGVRLPYDAELEGYRPAGHPGVDEPVIVTNAGQRGTPLDALIAASGVKSYVSVPMLAASGGVGWLTLSHHAAGAPSQTELPLLRALAQQLAPGVERSRNAARARVLAALVDDSPEGMLALDPAGEVREANPAALRLLGLPRARVIGHGLPVLLGEQGGRALASVLEAVEKGAPGQSEMLVVDVARGTERVWLDVIVGRVEDFADASFHVRLRDAGPRRAADSAIAQKMDDLSFLRALGDTVASDLRTAFTLERALDVCVTRGSSAAIGALRADPGGALRLVASRGIDARLGDSLAHVTSAELTRVTRGIEAWSLVLPLVHARRSWGALLVVGRDREPPSLNERWLWEAVAATLSASLRAAADFERVVALEAERRQLVDSLPVIVARIDPKSEVTSFANRAVETVLGVELTAVLGFPGLAGILADARERNAAAEATARAAQGARTDWQDRRYRHNDGRILTLRESVYPVLDASGAVTAVQIIAYDITNELETRSRLVQADRLSSLGALAGGIAHEINNPVAFIALAAGQMPKVLDRALSATETGAPNEEKERVQELSREIGEAAGRIAEIVGELKLFTRIPDGASSTPVDVNRILQMAITLTSGELRRTRLDVSLGDVPLAPGQFSILGQAFVNLLMNAAQAVNAAPPNEKHVVRVASSMKKGAIVVEVSDSGKGIAAQLLPRIFDPFFATEGTGESGNLGLAIAYDLVKRLGGDIRVTSTLGEGATFEMVLPLEPAMANDTRSSPRLYSVDKLPESGELSPRARAKILIIDDEMALAKALARQLAGRYDVDTASSASDALVQLGARVYDVVVCDLRMPDQSGPAIHDAVLARSQSQASRFIFTTGGSYGVSDDVIHERARMTGCPILEKPFDGAGFEAAVARVTER